MNKRFKLKLLSCCIPAAVLTSFGAGCAHADMSAPVAMAPWLTQMGIDTTILAAGKRGYGQLLGVVDTGIVANNAEFAAMQVSKSKSSCAAVTFRCSYGAYDDNGHGTAVASIAAGNSTLYGDIVYGGNAYVFNNTVVAVAPNANIVAEKVLNAEGSGYSTDVNNGIIRAANAGASVINLSLTFNNSPATVAAINYAASRGAFIVWAGGNDAQALLGGLATSGLTQNAISHLVFVGSVDADNVLSSFSNTPGDGVLAASSGPSSTYAARWIMAPGENIVAPYTPAGSGAYAYWSGTSMAAPLISGSLVLLESAWPILKTRGTAANLLLATATDLGTAGVDTTYGNGLVNVGNAFKPYGELSVTLANRNVVPVSNLTGTMISSGALGNLALVKSRLSSYTALDAYSRNFAVDLSGLIQANPSGATLNPLPAAVNTGPKKILFADGTQLSYLSAPTGNGTEAAGFALATDRRGTTTGFSVGNLVPVDYLFAGTLFADDTAAALAGGISNNLGGFTAGGAAMSYGMQWSPDTRIALAYSATRPAGSSIAAWTHAQATVFSAGLMRKINAHVQLGLTLQALDEPHGLLGSTYDRGAGFSLGSGAHTDEIGLSMLVTVDARNSFYVEAVGATTQGTSGSGGLLAGTSALRSQAFGASFSHRELFADDDKLTLTLKQPLRVASGSIGLVVTNIDSVTGEPSLGVERIGITPSGRELNCKLAYVAHVADQQTFSLEAAYIKDRMNVAGSNAAAIGVNWTRRF